jgi:sugar phosphate isomerase/epimerase
MLNGKYFKPALIGQGDIPTSACLKALKNIGYDGYINIEYESSDIPADQAIKQAIDFLNLNPCSE